MNSPALGLFLWNMIVLHLALGQDLSPVLLCSNPSTYCLDKWKVNWPLFMRQHWTERNLHVPAGLYGTTGFLFCLHTPLCQNEFWCQLHKFIQKSVYLISTRYTVWILQIQQCASQSRISTFQGLHWASWGEKHQRQTAELVTCSSVFVAECSWVCFLSFRNLWENYLLILHCDTLPARNSWCLFPIDIQSVSSGVIWDNNGARCW